MKKKVSKKKKPIKQKIDVVLESLLNLEQRTKELINRVEQLESIVCNIYNHHKPKYSPNVPRVSGEGYAGLTWNDGCQNKVSQ